MIYHIRFTKPCLSALNSLNKGCADRTRPQFSLRMLLAFVVPLFLSACLLGTHRVDIQQGNLVDEEMVSKLKLNMTREQVLFALGTPLIIDPFHPNRWDYIYMSGRAGDVDRVRGLTLEFKENRLFRIRGDVKIVDDAVQLQAAEL
ncbi:MAG: outer membrane protein assembly factor BamE [Betaproteobacteria bacterium]|nr:MAG: outer membrane protein assembly factor BamE [Betaproteobacteria bacterium]